MTSYADETTRTWEDTVGGLQQRSIGPKASIVFEAAMGEPWTPKKSIPRTRVRVPHQTFRDFVTQAQEPGDLGDLGRGIFECHSANLPKLPNYAFPVSHSGVNPRLDLVSLGGGVRIVCILFSSLPRWTLAIANQPQVARKNGVPLGAVLS
ncbi:uncharacterized protein ColSpa_09208 [Colletotrichum spaethianum]|uniref:Uncharacterized protein n=1 Tax=Colletotrichum spaethianum TaxID=700344 RepID=A0AA37PB81_9PEZI|nr:uncharacterized protein ColSpa_09208 [Colletotrichum spaethianum]GKT49027.1 hypothetical protein ColSpa_09208 [Colletotrichum spaethianum]